MNGHLIIDEREILSASLDLPSDLLASETTVVVPRRAWRRWDRDVDVEVEVDVHVRDEYVAVAVRFIQWQRRFIKALRDLLLQLEAALVFVARAAPHDERSLDVRLVTMVEVGVLQAHSRVQSMSSAKLLVSAKD